MSGLARPNALLIAAAGLLASRLLLSLIVIPPWQQPDENSHVALMELQRNRLAGSEALSDPAREAEILKSMASYSWWQHRGRPLTPVADARTFDTAGYGVGVSPTTSPAPMYHVVMGRVLSTLPRLSVVGDLYVVRAMSATLVLLTLLVAWLAARETLGAPCGAVVAALVALNPQFAVVSTSATPDAVINLLAACVWWQAAVAINGKNIFRALAVAWAAALFAASADRMGVSLLAVAAIASVAALVTAVRFGHWKSWFALPVGALTAAVAAGLSVWVLGAFGRTFALGSIFSSGWMPVPDALSWEFFASFTSTLHQSWWLTFGWVRYAPPQWWTAVAVALTMTASLGLGWRLIRQDDDARTVTLVAVAAVAVVTQILAVYWVYFRLGVGAQGKSLFPVMVPSLILLWAGIEAWVPEQHRTRAAVALVAVFAILDAAAWTLVALPAYAGL